MQQHTVRMCPRKALFRKSILLQIVDRLIALSCVRNMAFALNAQTHDRIGTFQYIVKRCDPYFGQLRNVIQRRQKLRRQLRTDLGNLLDDPSADLAIDDRSDAYGTMVELSDALGESSEGDRLTTKRLALLEKAAAAAASPVLAATFDAHRFDSYRRLKRWAIAEEMLLASAKALPSDYNPPARLARLYYETGRIEKAEAQIGTALSHCLGPRRASMFELRAAIQNSQNRSREAMASLMEAISVLTANQPAGAPESARVLSLRQQLAGLDAKRKEQPDDSDGAPQPVPPAQQNEIGRASCRERVSSPV